MPTAQAIRHGRFEDLGSFAAALTDAGYRIEYVEAADRDLAGIPRFGLISVFRKHGASGGWTKTSSITWLPRSTLGPAGRDRSRLDYPASLSPQKRAACRYRRFRPREGARGGLARAIQFRSVRSEREWNGDELRLHRALVLRSFRPGFSRWGRSRPFQTWWLPGVRAGSPPWTSK